MGNARNFMVWYEEGFEKFNSDAIGTKIEQIIESVENGRNIILSGDTGIGKTSLIEGLIEYYGLDVEKIKAEQMINCLKNEEGYIMSGLHMYPFIFIDDIAREKEKYMHYGEVIISFEQVMYDRESIKDPRIFATTRLTTVELSDRYGPNIISRLMENTDFYQLKGEDLRLC